MQEGAPLEVYNPLNRNASEDMKRTGNVSRATDRSLISADGADTSGLNGHETLVKILLADSLGVD